MRIWIATGGTGGHIFPALSVAQALNVRITISTDSRGYDLVRKNAPENARIVRIWASGVGNRGKLGKIFALTKIALSTVLLTLRFTISRPTKIIAFGGYSSVPPVLAGKLWRIPIFLHEQNAAAGKANALSARFATKILTSFPNTTGLPKNAQIELTGLPVRSDFKPSPFQFNHTIFITGGSLGASILLEVVPQAIALLPAAIKKNLKIVQQVNELHTHALSKFYTREGIKHRLAPFFKDMASEITNSSLVIGRSGASTVVELMTIGRPAILIPLNINPDQLANARAFEKQCQGIVIEQKNFTPKLLSKTIAELFSNPARLEKMAAAARTPNHAIQNILSAIK